MGRSRWVIVEASKALHEFCHGFRHCNVDLTLFTHHTWKSCHPKRAFIFFFRLCTHGCPDITSLLPIRRRLPLVKILVTMRMELEAYVAKVLAGENIETVGIKCFDSKTCQQLYQRGAASFLDVGQSARQPDLWWTAGGGGPQCLNFHVSFPGAFYAQKIRTKSTQYTNARYFPIGTFGD